ncbi:diguanylate cyclase domain-containing protein [Williamsia muralis]|uniref:GGDEF domain-containing protein n=1 Tax=Williamsia marianensis TaxID=85044 RepID=UPI0039E9786B
MHNPSERLPWSAVSRVLRWWCTEPFDYHWVHTWGEAQVVWLVARVCGVLCCGLYALFGMLIIAVDPGHFLFAQGLVLAVVAGFLICAGVWWFGSWPGPTRSALFVVFVDAAVTVYLVGGPPVMVLGLLNLFVVPGVYVTFVHGPRLLLAHLGYLVVVVVAAYTYVVVSTDISVVVAALAALTAISAGLATSIMAHIALTFLRHHARASFTDPLTGVLNRRGLVDALARSHTAHQLPAPTTAVVIDIDQFKAINDAHGHLTGDQVLTRTAHRLTELCRDEDTLARIGGDEFAIFAALNGDQASTFAEKIRRSLTTEVGVSPVSVSIGTATTTLDSWPPPYEGMIEEMLDHADNAMYRAKNAGGNRIVTAPTSHPRPSRRHPQGT